MFQSRFTLVFPAKAVREVQRVADVAHRLSVTHVHILYDSLQFTFSMHYRLLKFSIQKSRKFLFVVSTHTDDVCENKSIRNMVQHKKITNKIVDFCNKNYN